jgi:catechol 2,3-dioxygenase-like lactoylglutathione lyase family enzyme
MRLTKIGDGLIAVQDLARSKDFYTRVLGFEILEEGPDHGGVFMTVGEGTHVIDLVSLPGMPPPPVPQSFAELKPALGFGHVAFAVGSARDLRRAFHKSPVEFQHGRLILDHPHRRRIAWTRLCDGRRVSEARLARGWDGSR